MPKEKRNNNVPKENIEIAYTSTSSEPSVGTLLAATHTEISSGPLPHPDLMKKYDDIIAGGAERITRMAEKEQENRFENDRANRDEQRAELGLIKRGQTMAFVLCLLFITSGVTLACFGFGAIAYVLLGIGMAPVVGLFYNISHNK